MYLKSLELIGFKSFARKTKFKFQSPITSIVGPNGSGKSNVAEAFRFVLGEQSIKSMRGKRTEDLIFNGSRTAQRSGRAGVKLVFDNTKRLLDIDFDEALLERVIHRDATSEYSINGSRVRLKDIYELLAGAKIGASGHHIISQGEADRVLNVNARDRKVMIEDALGLKIYQYKKTESEKKLSKTEENIEKVQTLRKEIRPHLKFLQKQVDKIEKLKEQVKRLSERYQEYFAREKSFIDNEMKEVGSLMNPLKKEGVEISKKLETENKRLSKIESGDSKTAMIIELERRLTDAREKKGSLVRDVGRVEGEVSAETRSLEREKRRIQTGEEKMVLLSEVASLGDEIGSLIRDGLASESVSDLKEILSNVSSVINGFLSRTSNFGNHEEATFDRNKDDLSGLQKKLRLLEDELAKASNVEREIYDEYQSLKRSIEIERDSSHESERAVFGLTTRKNEVHLKIIEMSGRLDRLRLVEEEFKRELGEAAVIVGRNSVNYASIRFGLENEPREKQEGRKREIQKMKIRIEDSGHGDNEETLREFEEARERDEFLEREIIDLEKTAESLKGLISELSEKLDTEFESGINKINKEFNAFFGLMFGGGEASIAVVKEKAIKERDTGIGFDDEEQDFGVGNRSVEGVDIQISLPHKKIRGLEMLSGGERALTSIALIFAMSQVNPPPFLILDETDAALDEANSKRYGDMVESLSKKSQLILITHNRETMSRAGILYGITMGADGISQVLSVNFDEAVQVAK